MREKKKITISILFFSFFMLLIHFLNKVLFFISTIKEFLFSKNGSYYNWRFGKIFYTKSGTGTPLLLIHDIDCTSSDYEWHYLVETLSKQYTIYTIDLLGCGRSDKPKLTYTNFLYVQLISDFIKNIIKEKTNILATGMSSSVIIMTCYMDKQLCKDIILINPPDINIINQYPGKKEKLLKYIIDFPIFGTLFYNIITSYFKINYTFKKYYFYSANQIHAKDIMTYREAAHLKGISAKYMYSSNKCGYINVNIVHALKEINNSIYIICGQLETNIDAIIKQYITLNPSIEFSVIKNTKHLPHLEDPNKFLNIIDIYISK